MLGLSRYDKTKKVSKNNFTDVKEAQLSPR